MKLVEAIVKPFKLNEIAIDRDMYVDCQHAGFFKNLGFASVEFASMPRENRGCRCR